MALSINTNVPSLNAQRNLESTQNQLSVALQRLSSGLRINSAKDDAAGMAISERFTTQIRGLNQAVRNANDGISFAQVTEASLSSVSGALQRIRELSVQSINDSNSSSDREALNNEVSQLISEVNRIANSAQFNGQNVLDGTLSNLTFQVGANQNQTISVNGVDARGSQLGARTTSTLSFSQLSADALVTANDLVIQGNTIDLSGYAAGELSDADLVNEINAVSSTTGVEALRGTQTSVDLTALLTGTSATAESFIVNGVTVSYNRGSSATATATNISDAMASLETQTGLTVTDNGGGSLTFANDTGETIVFEQTGGGTGVSSQLDDGAVVAGLAATGGTYYAGITFAGDVSSTDYSVAGSLESSDGSDADLTAATSGTQSNNTLSGVDVLTSSTANDALLTLDFALQQVNGLRAELGAVQVRFETTITSLESTSENLTAARGRIVDADFAAETANLTKTQILQQAGVAIVGQANALPQLALSLLQ